MRELGFFFFFKIAVEVSSSYFAVAVSIRHQGPFPFCKQSLYLFLVGAGGVTVR